jgi:hypothetical protein
VWLVGRWRGASFAMAHRSKLLWVFFFFFFFFFFFLISGYEMETVGLKICGGWGLRMRGLLSCVSVSVLPA